MLRSRCASVSVQKALKDSMSKLSKEVHLAGSDTAGIFEMGRG